MFVNYNTKEKNCKEELFLYPKYKFLLKQYDLFLLLLYFFVIN